MLGELAILDVEGTPRERGVAQGIRFGSAIAGHFDAMVAAWRLAGVGDVDAFLRDMYADTQFEEAIRRHTPHLAEEMAGIAEGAGLDTSKIYALNLIDEGWAYSVWRQKTGALVKCMSFALRDTKGTNWIGQNMDLGAYTDGFQRVVRHAPDGGRAGSLILTLAGTLALLGVNDHGVGVCVNSIPQVPSARRGLPVAFMIRHLLEQPSARQAASLCRSLPHATNQHYLIADADEIYSLEASSDGVADAGGPQVRVLHSNHPLVGRERYPDGEENSVARLVSLERRLSGEVTGLETLQAALTAFDDPKHPVCRLREDELGIISFTTGSMISALRRERGASESYISLGPPSLRGYTHAGVTSVAAA